MCSYVIPQWFIDSGLINRPRLMQVWFALLRWSEEAASREPQTIEVAPYSFPPQAAKAQSPEPQTKQTAQAAPDNRTRRFSISNLSRALGIPRSSVRRAIAQLTAFGLVASKTDTHNSFIIIKNTASYMVPPETVRPWPRPAIPAVTEKSPLKEETKERKNQRNKNKEEINLQRENPLKGACAREGTNVTCRGTNDEIDAEKNSADLTEQNSNSGLLEVLSIESLAPQDAPYFFSPQAAKALSIEPQATKVQSLEPQAAKTQSFRLQNAKAQSFRPQAAKAQSLELQTERTTQASTNAAPYFFSPQAANTPSFRLQNDKVQSLEPQAEQTTQAASIAAPYFFTPQSTKAQSIEPQSAKALSIGPQTDKAQSLEPQAAKALSIGPQTTKAQSLEPQDAPYFFSPQAAKVQSFEPQAAKALSIGPQTTKAQSLEPQDAPYFFSPQAAKVQSFEPQTEKTLSIGPQATKAESLELQTERTTQAAPVCPASPQTAQAASIAARQERFEGEVAAFEGRYSHEMLLDFAAYWTEPNRSGSKMRFEMERTWKLSLRLATWARHERMYNANKRPQSSRNQNLNYEYQRTCPDRLSYEARERLDRETRQRDAAGLMSRLAAQNRPYQG